MAKQVGPNFIVGTIDNLTFYEMNGEYYVKKKTDVGRRRIYNDPGYANTLRNSKWFGGANTLAGKVYREVPVHLKDQRKVWYPMLKRANALARLETPAEEFLRILREEFVIPLNKSIRVTEVPPRRMQQPVFPAPDLQDEILLGRAMNKAVPLSVLASGGLIDQLAASSAFVRNILRQDKIVKGRIRKLDSS